MKEIDDNSIAGCITDPPYNYEFIGRNWDDEEIERRIKRSQEKESSTLVKNIPYGSGLAGGVRNERWYKKNRDNILEYRDWIKVWGAELFRVLKPGSYVLVFNSTRTSRITSYNVCYTKLLRMRFIAFVRRSRMPRWIMRSVRV